MQIISGTGMLTKLSFGLALAWFLPACVLLAQSPPSADADRAAIRGIVKEYVDAREKQDPKAVESLFTSDADQLVSSGEWRKGRTAVVKGTLNSSKQTGGKRTITVESIRFVTPDVALADGRYRLAELAGNTQRDMWTTLLLTRTAGGWRISAIRNMLPAPPAPVKTSEKPH
jgi:uncharacterized protein (TIGR02246 family)